ncbi:MAG TPA: formimidoylglutamate deiminase [Steroidobacteraceae bacterium]|nr:formimidoylglutamate deiminase [Steroidobacteraceae bacterium]
METPRPALYFDAVLLPDGWAERVRVTVANGRFATLERDVAPRAGDEKIAVALPGMPNVHSHAFQRGMAGFTEFRGPDADNFWSWRTLMYRFVGRMSPDDLEAISAQAFVEMLESGFTRVGEFHYVHHDTAGRAYADPAEMTTRVAAAAAQTGIALTLLPVFYAHGGFGGAVPTDGQRRFILDVPRFARLLEDGLRIVSTLPDARLGVAPHSLRAVTPAELAEVVALVPGAPVHIHAAEQTGEVEQCVAWSGARPVEWLLANAPVDARWCFVHATHLTDDETQRLAASGAVAGFCPVTEANLGDGIAPAKAFIGAGGAFGIGTDSNVLIGVADELRQLEYCQRLRDRARNVIELGATRSTGRVLFDGAVRGGARSLGLTGAQTGIAAGAPADLVSLDVEAPALVGRRDDALVDSLVFAGGSRCIDGVWRGGEKVVTRGRHRYREPVANKFRTALKRVLEG